jgi:hypothetical protein
MSMVELFTFVFERFLFIFGADENRKCNLLQNPPHLVIKITGCWIKMVAKPLS